MIINAFLFKSLFNRHTDALLKRRVQKIQDYKILQKEGNNKSLISQILKFPSAGLQKD